MKRFLALATLCVALLYGGTASAGLGPENVCLVVNSRSWASRTIANHYVALRNIPPCNVVEIDWPAQIDVTTLEEFRMKILVPVLKEMQTRGIAGQIDAIVYSSDFPYSVRFGAGKGPTDRFAVASITALTAFAPAVLLETPPDFARLSNPYAAAALAKKDQPGIGFRSRIGRANGNTGEAIYLSAMLGYTSGRGNSVAEVIAYLTRSAAADATAPRGTIYYCRNSDVRSKTREPGFADAVARLEKLGVKAAVIDGEIPSGKRDVQGAMIGAAEFDWKRSGATILPGAICENLTSYGGILHPRKGQTPLSELLRNGAAGASGTVVEPYAIQAKFPDPMVQVYYAGGATMVEAFYQSVLAPYQLLVVGEPLCAPWARAPQVQITGLAADEAIDAPRTITATFGDVPKDYSAAECQWFLDGVRVQSGKPNAPFELVPAKLTAGGHELRAVVIGSDARATQARAIVPFAAKHEGSKSLEMKLPTTARYGETIAVNVAAEGAAGTELFHEATSLGNVRGAKGTIKIATDRLGMGPARLIARAKAAGGKPLSVSAHQVLNVEVPTNRINAKPPVSSQLARGILVSWGAGKSDVMLSTSALDCLAKIGVPANTAFTANSWFDVPRDGVYQFQLRFNGQFSLSVDGQELFNKTVKIKEQSYIPVALKSGLHLLEFKGTSAPKAPTLDFRFGDTPVDYLESQRFRHEE